MTQKIMDDVELGDNSNLEDFVILGVKSSKPPINPPHEGKLIIGDNAKIRSHSVIYRGNKIGNNFQTGHGVLIRENNLIGDDVSIGSHSVVERENVIGNKVRIHSNCFVPEFVNIKDKVWLAPSVTILNMRHPPCPKFNECAKGVVIKENAKIGSNVTLGPKVIIGKNSLVGCGSVVVQSIPDDSVAVGNPARVIKNVSDLTCELGYYGVPYEWESD
ncbi:MAG: transferase [Thermoplasmata archaeon]|nr:MAG: transferase [Thermoplasmata archaeon]